MSLHQDSSLYKYMYLLTKQEKQVKQDTTLQIRINQDIKRLVQEQLGDTSISDFIRNKLTEVLVAQAHRGWKVDEYRQTRI